MAGNDGKFGHDGQFMKASSRWLAILVPVLLMIALRVLWPDSDAYPRLSWSTALLTDEGFYSHNARNLVLYGHARLDGWNNMLIMPLLHLVQVCVFRIWGVGIVQVRMISVMCSIATLAILWDGLRRLWGGDVANWALLFLGLDHVNLLYNRLGLMDTPCALFMVGAWWLSAPALRGCIINAEQALAGSKPAWFRCPTWQLALCGVISGAAYAVRGLSALVWWIPIWISTRRIDESVWPAEFGATNRRLTGGYSFGLTVAIAAYAVTWWWPHRNDIAHVSQYYIGRQLLPHSVQQLADNLHKSMDWDRGLFPYLLKHTPVQFVLVLLCVVAKCTVIPSVRRFAVRMTEIETVSQDASRGDQHGSDTLDHIRLDYLRSSAEQYLVAWFLVFFVFCCCVNYSPSRYYVLFYPAQAGLAAIFLRRISRTLAGLGHASDLAVARYWVHGILSLWAVVNILWLADWIRHMTYRQRAADHWLALNMPRNSVLLGDVSLGLCLNNRLRTINVIPHLCNDDRPVERLGTATGYIVLIDDKWREPWWDRHYPKLLTPERRIHTFQEILRPFFNVGLYLANDRSATVWREAIKRNGGQK